MSLHALQQYLSHDLVLYDASRLLSRRLAPIATGIDRIDLTFARDLAQAYGKRLVFVAKLGQSGVVVPRNLMDDLLESLHAAWFQGQANNHALARNFARHGLVEHPFPPAATGRTMRSLANWGHRKIATLRHPDFLHVLARETGGRQFSYFVCSHQGLARVPGLLQKMRARLDMKVVAYINDLIPIRYPEYIRPQQIGILEAYLAELAGARAQFLGNSRYTAQELRDYIEQQGWRLPKAAAVLPDIELPDLQRNAPNASIRDLIKTTSPYFVVLGTIEARKNHLLLLNIWRDLVHRGEKPIPHLHIVGSRGWENANVIALMERCAAIRPHISEHNSLDDTSLFHLLKNARALLFPSFAEGLGLPLMEAQRLGVAAIATNLPVYREFVGGNVTFLDPLDGAGWKQAILQACKVS